MANKEQQHKEEHLKNIIAHAKEYGYIFPSSEIYDGLAAIYDYGQLGVELKNNIKNYWWMSMVQLHENIVGVDTAIFMHPNTWKASGHVEAFNDPLIDNKDSKKRYRADVLIEEHIEKYRQRNIKEIEKAKSKFGESFDEKQFISTNTNVISNNQKIENLEERMRNLLDTNDLEGIRDMIIDLGIVCPISGSKNWTDVRQFNLMFSTEMGSVSNEASEIYLRPETAQGIFVNFLNVQKTGRLKLPFGIAQIGKAFRNEIIARQFIFRMREFEQMEMQFFVRPGEELKWFHYWKAQRKQWHLAMSLGEENYRFHDHIKLAHYANAATDIEFNFPMGFKELEGIHSRTDFDLKQHEQHSGKKMQYFDPHTNESYTPYVVETSVGLDRLFLSVLSSALRTETLKDGTQRTVLSIPAPLAPYKVAVMPLTKKDGLPEKARIVYDSLKRQLSCQYDEKDSPGKRYRRQDAMGTPYCVMIDHQTLEDDTVTIRNRDTMEQERVRVVDIASFINEKVSLQSFFSEK